MGYFTTSGCLLVRLGGGDMEEEQGVRRAMVEGGKTRAPNDNGCTQTDRQGCLIFRNGVDLAQSGAACGHGSEKATSLEWQRVESG